MFSSSIKILFILTAFSICNAFMSIHRPLLYSKKGCKIESRELRIDIDTESIEKSENSIIKKISGFYGLVGPDISVNYLTTLYELFTGNGVIQGVFFENGNVTFVKHFIRTEKLLFEEKFGVFSKNFFWIPLYIALNKLGVLPNVLGLANTAGIVIENNLYTLFERDLPYLMRIDFENRTVGTVNKMNIRGIERFSAHSKYDTGSKTIHSIDYSVFHKTLSYFQLSSEFDVVRRFDISTERLPIIHDFAILENGILFCESPFELDISRFLQSKIPVKFSTNPTKFVVYNSKEGITKEYLSSDPFYIFHYGDVFENVENIRFFASVYNTIDFDSLDIKGNYRMFSINKSSGIISVFKNDAIEKYNLDFPIVYYCKSEKVTYTILRNIENNYMNGFVVCKELEIVRTIFLTDQRHICGEPSLIDIDGSPYLTAFAYDDMGQGYLEIIPVFDSCDQTKEIIEIALPCDTTIGFHSVFVNPTSQ